jgi:hypothetical protein
MAKPDHTEDEVPSLKQLFRWPKSKSPRTPSLTRGVAILSTCVGIYLFVAFVPARPGHHSSKYFLIAIALYWTGRSIEEIVAARASKRCHSHHQRSNQALQPTAGRHTEKLKDDLWSMK